MLIRFNVKNFLSFSERENGLTEEFSMLAGKVRNKKEHIYDDGKLKLLKFAALYGANASGKSNLVKAFNFMKRTVIRGLPRDCGDKYCKSNITNREKPSYFELEILIGDKYYAYGFEVILSQGKFVSEWLVEMVNENSEREIFVRDILEGKYDINIVTKNKQLRQKLDFYAEDIKDDDAVLYLSIMNQNKKNLYKEFEEVQILKDIYNWIAKSLDINFPNQPISDYSYLAKTENIEEICKIISGFGTGITNLKIVDVPEDEVISQLPKPLRETLMECIGEKKQEDVESEKSRFGIVMRSNREFFMINVSNEGTIQCRTIQFYHGEQSILFQLREESDGTIRILDLLEILLIGEGKTYIIDELDRCLHPSLSYKFVQTFLQLAHKRNIQLIVTTHESRLLDLDLLRRDEIWFMNKRVTGESDIYSLEEYNTRFDQKIDKAYLEGRYGGVPIFSTVFPIREE